MKKNSIEWSEDQKLIFSFIKSGKGNGIIIARAGASKTTTLVESVRYLPVKKDILFVAFNKKIAEELDKRIYKSYVQVSTLHSLGYKAIINAFGKSVKFDSNKTFKIVRDYLFKENTKDIQKSGYAKIFTVCNAISLCKSYLVDTPAKIDDLLDDFGINLSEYSREEFISIIIQCLNLCKKKKDTIDFDDMIYFCIVYNLQVGKWNVVYIDEGQDLNISQIYLALSACKKDGRVITCLDNYQSLYGWRGADKNAIETIMSKTNAQKFSLPTSYRCAKNIIKLAQRFVPDIKAASFAKEGMVSYINENQMLSFVKPGDFILSRTNAPLIEFCLTLLHKGVRANIQGKDVGVNLAILIKQANKKTVPEFLEWLKKWERAETDRLSKKHRDTSSISDKVNCLERLCKDIGSMSKLLDKIDALFKDGDDQSKVILSSTHQAKGLERNRVFMLNWTYKESTQEEKNIKYVAITRAKEHLFIVN